MFCPRLVGKKSKEKLKMAKKSEKVGLPQPNGGWSIWGWVPKRNVGALLITFCVFWFLLGLFKPTKINKNYQ